MFTFPMWTDFINFVVYIEHRKKGGIIFPLLLGHSLFLPILLCSCWDSWSFIRIIYWIYDEQTATCFNPTLWYKTNKKIALFVLQKWYYPLLFTQPCIHFEVIVSKQHVKVNNSNKISSSSNFCPPSHPGSHSWHGCTHRGLYVASTLVNVARHLCLPPRHRRLPHPVRVAQPVRYDAAWTQQRPGVLFLLRAQRVLRYSLWEDGGHQAPEVLDRSPADEPVGHLLSVLSVHLHSQSGCRHGRREDLRTAVRDTWPKGTKLRAKMQFLSQV